MSTQTPGPNRLARTAAKEVPHRKADRFFAARTDLRNSCEDLLKDIQLAPLHEAMRKDLVDAIKRVDREVQDLGPDDSGARNTIVDLEKQVQHLQLAAKWVGNAQRVLDKLPASAKPMRDGLLEAQDSVMWHVRADAWDGQLTAALSNLKAVVQEAETAAARA